MQLILNKQTVQVDPMELRAVRAIVGRFFTCVKDGAKKVGNPTFYWTFVTYTHEFSGMLLDQLDIDDYKKNMEAVARYRERMKKKNKWNTKTH